MALSAYLFIEGETSGVIEGSVEQVGLEGLIEVYALAHTLQSPRDPETGLPAGRPQHLPLTITKPLDRASPLIMRLLTHNEAIREFRLDLYQPNRTGVEERYYSIELAGGAVSDIRYEQLNNRYPENQAHTAREHVSFVYGSITWTFHIGGEVTHMDDWGS